MKAKLVTLGMAVVLAVALVFEVSTITSANQENANTAATAKPRKKRMRKPGGRSRMMAGVPMGVENCLNHLAKMAAADPLIDYEGHPSEIVNNGLLWNDPKSKCAITDEAQRKKVFDLANAWRMKDAATVRSVLQGMGATATTGNDAGETQPAPGSMGSTPAAPSRRSRRPRRPAETTTPAEPTGTEPQVAPPTEGAENANRRTPRRGRRTRNRNANTSSTANSNSGF
jgi:hypothetical protein